MALGIASAVPVFLGLRRYGLGVAGGVALGGLGVSFAGLDGALFGQLARAVFDTARTSLMDAPA